LLLLLIALVVEHLNPKVIDILPPPNLVMFQGNTLIAPLIPENIKTYVLGVITGDTISNADLIDCMIQQESSGNEKAYNKKDTDGRPKSGCLQFDTRTFATWCVKKYSLKNDIWDCDIQRLCADKMIQDGLIGHWGKRTRVNCLK
jgi:hypothetical protein